MKATTLASGFRALTPLSVICLWGFFAYNGGAKAMVLAAWTGKLNEEIPLRNSYTGIFIIDFPITLLVAFFHFATNGSDEGYQLFVLDGYSTLQSSFVWLFAEMMRPGSKPWPIATPLFFAFMNQFLGGAISLPIYYAYHILWADSAEILRVQDPYAARALPFSFLLGAIFPAILSCVLPAMYGPGLRSPEAHQKILFFFQADPLWVILTQNVLAALFRLLDNAPQGEGGDLLPRAPKTAYRWIRASYLIAAASSAAGHIYAAARMYISTDKSADLLRLRVPLSLSGPLGGLPDILARGPHLFLQFDIPIFELTSMVWTFWLLTNTPNRPRVSNFALACQFLIGYFTIGAGATVSLALFVREGLLPEKEKLADYVVTYPVKGPAKK